MAFRIIILALCISVIKGYIVNPGPLIVATRGEVWPKPQRQETFEQYYILRPKTFKFQLAENSSNCNLLQSAFDRYWNILQQNSVFPEKTRDETNTPNPIWEQDVNFLGYLDQLVVSLNGPCNDTAYPEDDVDESYSLTVNQDDGAKMDAGFIWGILRGLETFSQLIYYDDDKFNLWINATSVQDYPRFGHRGLLLDTSRHFIPLKQIYLTLDAMAYNKMNVFHWHIVDDQSFPYVSKKFPELSGQGAYDPHTHVYDPEDVQNVIEYARLRGIRVMPEFDTPGHTRSWGVSHPELLCPCNQTDEDMENLQATEEYGPIDPTKNETYDFLKDLFTEVRQVFRDQFIHLGGDEVGFECWESNPNITAFMKENDITTYEGVESYYIQKVIDMVDAIGFDSIVWEEVFVNGVQTPNKTIIHVWRSGWQDTISNVTKAGKPALLSACWYLDSLHSGGDWDDFYKCEPTDFDGSEDQKKLIIGGEACMWAEAVNEFNVISRVWPRASAVAERLWSNISVIDYPEAQHRLEEHTCRMNRRGIGAQPPNAAGFCD